MNIPESHWYYQIEVEPGRFTPGTVQPSLGLVREALQQADLTGQSVLDIGTQDFAVPIHLAAAGAGSVVCYDRLSKGDQLDFLKSIYDFDPHYVHGVALHDLKEKLVSLDLPKRYDVVVFAGILYHMVDPLSGLAMARSFLREGGLMILETVAAFEPGQGLLFNARGSKYGPSSNYFVPKVATLDYFCRMLRMEVLDFTFFGRGFSRTLTVLRARDRVLPEDGDEWMGKHWVERDFYPFGLRYDELRSEVEPVPYTPFDEGALVRRPEGLIDMEAMGRESPVRARNPDLSIVRMSDARLKTAA